MKFNEGFLAQMREATKLLQTEGPAAAAAVIQRALHGAAPGDGGHDEALTRAPAMPQAWRKTGQAPETGDAHESAGSRRRRPPAARSEEIEDIDFVDVRKDGKDIRDSGGRFVSASCTNHAGTRNYKLYIPGGYKDEPLPLVVMLHGCTQNPDDFAEGTGMNRLAEEGNFLVAYPEQGQAANATQCWNWFQPAHQQRGQGEPSIIADITREIATAYRVDTRRVYIAGLSAGGAMAAVVAAAYPELYAAVGIHSGLPCGVARDLPSAFAAMKRSRARAPQMKAKVRTPASIAVPVPAIIFHGDADATVHPENADQIWRQFVPDSDRAELEKAVRQGRAPNGRSYTQTIVSDGSGRPVGEKWIVHGAGHAWSGGSRNGTYTDPQGPSASQEMMRFFLQRRSASSA